MNASDLGSYTHTHAQAVSTSEIAQISMEEANLASTVITDTNRENAYVARHGWAALLQLLEAKGLITHEDAQAVITKAHLGAQEAARIWG